MSKKQTSVPAQKIVRCAIYTRKSTEEGLQQEFNSLDAQRESAEAYISSMKHEGWVCLPDRYDDGGFTGGNVDRPAVQRLLKDIQAHRIDCVVVYKVDRLSRSLLDFAKIMEVFEKDKVSFVSVTQQFNTIHSMGRLTLNILLSFAQFEREIISERTRDKIAAARRKGKFVGGRPVLGYDLISSPAGSKLVVNNDEAERVKTIFNTYLKFEALMPTVNELSRLGWKTKEWQTKAGRQIGGKAIDKSLLYNLLTNIVYTGKVSYRDEVYAGEHEGIVSEEIWQRVKSILKRNSRTGGAQVRNKYGALLKGLLRCVPCNCSMGHTYSAQETKRYRYYVCLRAQKRGWSECPTKSVPAIEMEKFVLEQIKAIGKDPTVLSETLKQMQSQKKTGLTDLQKEQRTVEAELVRGNEELRKLVTGPDASAKIGAMANLQDRIRADEQRSTRIQEDITALRRELIDEREVSMALSSFEPVWDTLCPREQARIIRLLVERVDYDGKNGTVAVTFRPNGIKTLSQDIKETAACK